MGQEARLSAGHHWLRHRPWQRVALPLHLLQERRRSVVSWCLFVLSFPFPCPQDLYDVTGTPCPPPPPRLLTLHRMTPCMFPHFVHPHMEHKSKTVRFWLSKTRFETFLGRELKRQNKFPSREWECRSSGNRHCRNLSTALVGRQIYLSTHTGNKDSVF